jgi:hypothetical protein
MNRRTLLAGIPALLPAVALSQDATPEAFASPADVMRAYIRYVANGGDIERVYDLFSPAVFDLDDLYWQYVEDDASRRRQGGARWSTDTVAEQGTRAFAYTYRDGIQALMMVHVAAGKIVALLVLQD